MLNFRHSCFQFAKTMNPIYVLMSYTNSSPGVPWKLTITSDSGVFFFLPLIKINHLLICVLLSGRHHDEKGDLKDWWTPESNERFLELSKCMVNQYSNFTVDAESGTHVCSPCGFLLPPHFNSCLTASGSSLMTIFDLSTCLCFHCLEYLLDSFRACCRS